MIVAKEGWHFDSALFRRFDFTMKFGTVSYVKVIAPKEYRS